MILKRKDRKQAGRFRPWQEQACVFANERANRALKMVLKFQEHLQFLGILTNLDGLTFMLPPMLRIPAIVTCIVIVMAASCHFLKPDPPVDFSAQVKPILNNKCISCHGGVKAKAGFSLLFREEALARTESGSPAIIPGNASGSEMIRRIKHSDPQERMPYKHEPLSKEETRILERWIDEGAKWGDHWAYLPVKNVHAPKVEGAAIINSVDNFIAQKIQLAELQQSPMAAKDVLLRRVSLDLIGTLPSADIADKFLNSADSGAYEMLVDSLLASTHFGERWASMWLDIARYADTKGYEADIGRNIWKYRDWVIDAFNSDKHYDKFITEQIAGDLLKNPTDENYIATAFHRNTMTNDEGGTDNEEFRVAAVLDRVNTTWESLMSTTFSCVQCHSHPYDPFRHEDYYKFMAYFNNTRDEDTGGDFPLLREFDEKTKQKAEELTGWVKKNASAKEAAKVDMMIRTLQPSYYSAYADSLKDAVIENNNSILSMRSRASARFRNVALNNANRFVYQYYTPSKGGTIKLRRDAPDGPIIASFKVPAVTRWQTAIADFPLQNGKHDIYIDYSNSEAPKRPDEFRIIFDWIAFTSALPGDHEPDYVKKDNLYKELISLQTSGTPVMVENNREMSRKSHVFERGNWRETTAEVEPGIPEVMQYAMPVNAPKNRMGLAMWLTNTKNPLVSRTMVNRLWEQLFGTGIVETLEDMGTQGILPTHQDLLDHLSYRFMNEFDWSVKKLLKEMVMSHTYRQDSRSNDELNEKDPSNKLYARGARVRLSAEQIRDQHLQISGMLSTKMHGPGVMPWQPDGIWFSPYNGARWQTDTGENHYRRAVYTYWKRSAPYPSMIAFDGAQRNVCSARRIRTNTPLQALVTLNDSVYVDLAAKFAQRMKKEGGNDIEKQIAKGYRLMLYKDIRPEKLRIFTDLYHQAGADTNALKIVANAMLNLDEVITKN